MISEQIEMTFAKSTKNTHQYKTEDSNAAITTAYVNKNALPSVPPKQITITLSE